MKRLFFCIVFIAITWGIPAKLFAQFSIIEVFCRDIQLSSYGIGIYVNHSKDKVLYCLYDPTFEIDSSQFRTMIDSIPIRWVSEIEYRKWSNKDIRRKRILSSIQKIKFEKNKILFFVLLSELTGNKKNRILYNLGITRIVANYNYLSDRWELE